MFENPLSFAAIIAALQARQLLSLARYGDGEWRALLGLSSPQRANCDGSHYFTELGAALQAALTARLTDPVRYNYEIGMQPLAWRIFGQEIAAWLATRPAGSWANGDIVYKASLQGNLPAFVAALSALPAVFVVPKYVAKALTSKFPQAQFIAVPELDAWLDYDGILAAVRKAADGIEGYGVVVLSCGMSAEVLLHDLYADYGQRLAILDVGSIWDPYAGRNTRSYHVKLPTRTL